MGVDLVEVDLAGLEEEVAILLGLGLVLEVQLELGVLEESPPFLFTKAGARSRMATTGMLQ